MISLVGRRSIIFFWVRQNRRESVCDGFGSTNVGRHRWSHRLYSSQSQNGVKSPHQLFVRINPRHQGCNFLFSFDQALGVTERWAPAISSRTATTISENSRTGQLMGGETTIAAFRPQFLRTPGEAPQRRLVRGRSSAASRVPPYSRRML